MGRGTGETALLFHGPERFDPGPATKVDRWGITSLVLPRIKPEGIRLMVSKTKLVAMGVSLFVFVITITCLGIEAPECAEQVYYSIHVQSFQDLKNANRYVNSLKKKGKMVFWKKTNIPGKGQFYRVYLDKYKTEAEALEFWKKLKEEGAVSYRGIHKFKETMTRPEKEELPPTTFPEKKAPAGTAAHVSKEDRFLDNRNGTITDRATNLMWVKNGWRIDFVSALKWKDARTKCENFRHGGYTNWRLPTVEEWKTLLDRQKESPALVEPNPFENIIVHMPYWSGTGFVYGRRYTRSTTASTVHAYTVLLYFGKINHQSKNRRAFVMPVRSIN